MSVTVAQLKAVLDIDDTGFRAGLSQGKRDLQSFAQEGERAGQRVRRALKEIDVDSLGKLGGKLTAGVTVPLMAVGAGALWSATRLDSLKRGLTAVAGSSEEAERQLKRLEEVARLPGLGFEEAIQGSINLQAAGFSATLAERSLGAFGNALATVGKGRAELEGVTTALTQIASKGKISAEEINQLAERVPQIRKVMEAAFGTSNTEKLQEMEIDATEFVEKITAELEKLPRVTGGAANTFENLQQSGTKALATLGNAALRAAVPFAEWLGPNIERAADGFADLHPNAQLTILGLAGVAAAAGPVAFGFNEIVEGSKNARRLWQSLVKAAGILTGAKVADTAATTAHSGAVAHHTIAETLNTGALARNTVALEANAVAAGRAAVSRGLLARVGLGGAMPFVGSALGVGAMVVGGIAAANSLNDLQDHMRGVRTPGDWWKHLNPLRTEQDDLGDADRDAAALRERMQEEFAAKGTPRQQKLREQAAARVETEQKRELSKKEQEELQRAGLAAFEAELERARVQAAGSPEEQRAAEEAKTLIPLLQKRQQELASQAGALKGSTDAKEQQKYWGLVREQWQVQGDIQSLQAAAAKEQKDAQKQVEEKAKQTRADLLQARASYFDTLIGAARDSASDANEDERARTEAQSVIPALRSKQQDLAEQARALLPELKGSAEAQARYWDLGREIWGVQAEINGLLRRASAEEQKAIKDAEKERLEAYNAYQEAQEAMLGAMSEAAPEGRRAQESLRLRLPRMKAIQAEMLQNLQAMSPETKEYHEQVKEYWELQGDIQGLEQAAAKEQQGLVKKATEDAKKAAQEAQQLAGAQTGLLEAQLGNLKKVGLNKQQSAKMLLPAVIAEFRQAFRPVQGEGEQERTQRLTQGEQLGGKALDLAKSAGLNLRAVYRDLQGLAQGAASLGPAPLRASVGRTRPAVNAPALAGAGGPAGGPMVSVPINLDGRPNLRDPQLRQQIHREVDVALDAALRRLYGGG